MNGTAPLDITGSLEARILAQIPLTRAMQLRAHSYDDDQLTLAAPLAPNINDKGCAFGGSLATLMTLAGWGLILLKLENFGIDCDVYVQDSTIHYLEPVWSDFVAQSRLASGKSWDAFAAALRSRGRARVHVHCRIPLAHGDASTLKARYVAVVRSQARAD